MQSEIRQAIEPLLRKESVESSIIQHAIGAIMDGRCEEAEIAALLTALEMKGVTSEELAGAAEAMRERVARIPTRQTELIDTCGTGGDNLHTFNISTATALVVAATGLPVAKHGNRSVSSSSGSADVLEHLGVNIDLTAEQAGLCLDEVGICFCYARTCHSAMKYVAPVRQKLGFRTIFNLLGPLTNPASAEYQLLGAPRNHYAEIIASAAARLGLTRTLVVCGNDQLDEVALWGTTKVWDVQRNKVEPLSWSPADFGLPELSPEQLKVSSIEESAEIIRGLLQGKMGPHRDIVLANAAAALYCRGTVPDLVAGVVRAAEAIDTGDAASMLRNLAEWTTYQAESQQDANGVL